MASGRVFSLLRLDLNKNSKFVGKTIVRFGFSFAKWRTQVSLSFSLLCVPETILIKVELRFFNFENGVRKSQLSPVRGSCRKWSSSTLEKEVFRLKIDTNLTKGKPNMSSKLEKKCCCKRSRPRLAVTARHKVAGEVKVKVKVETEVEVEIEVEVEVNVQSEPRKIITKLLLQSKKTKKIEKTEIIVQQGLQLSQRKSILEIKARMYEI